MSQNVCDLVYSKCREEREQKRTPQKNGAHDILLDSVQKTVVNTIYINPSWKTPQKNTSPSNGT